MAPFGRSATAVGAWTRRRLFTGAGAPTTATPATPATPAFEPIDQRSLFVRVRPAPATLSERRSVLRVLERHGKTEMFKKMANNASFLAITSTAAAAAALVEKSPIQYEFMADRLQTAHPWDDPSVATRVQPVETTGTTDTTERSEKTETAQVTHKSFVVSVFPSHDYHHRTMIRNSPLHGPWPRDYPTTAGSSGAAYKNTFVYNALKAVVPESAVSEGLCDWRTEWDSSGGATAIRTSSGDSPQDRPPTDKALAHIRRRKMQREQAGLGPIARLMGREDVDVDDSKPKPEQ